MLDNDNIISENVSKAVDKIPTDEKNYHKWSFMCFSLRSHRIQHNTNTVTTYNTRKDCLPTMMYPVKLKNEILKSTQKKVQ